MLKDIFSGLCRKFTNREYIIQSAWDEISEAYSKPQRFYHNLLHLQQVLKELEAVKYLVTDPEACRFALFYHDLVYNPGSPGNEEQSAAIARERLSLLGVPIARVQLCEQMILATKDHKATNNRDVEFFTDADLSILGSSREVYVNYAFQIRKEFEQVPDALYQAGRCSVLKRFLNMPTIYKTGFFIQKYEEQARKNLEMELKNLRCA